MLIAFSQLGYEAYRKLQGEFIDFETGEILNSEKWKDQMSDGIYKQSFMEKSGVIFEMKSQKQKRM